MKSVVTADMLFRQLNNTQAVLRERIGMNDRELTDAENEALVKMASGYPYSDVNWINKSSKEKLHRAFMRIKRIEAKDIWWLPHWRFIYNHATNKIAKDLVLKMGVYFLIHEDLRKPIGDEAGDNIYTNLRRSVSGIHEEYAMVLGVSVKKVSFAIGELEREGLVGVIEAFNEYLDCDETGCCTEIETGVVYVPYKVFYCKVVDGKKHTFSERRL